MNQAHLDDLQRSGLTAEHARKLRMASTGPNSYKIPYFAPSGKVVEFFRTKHFYTDEYLARLKKAKKKAPPKYTQPAGTEPHIYLPPLLGTKWSAILGTPKTPLVITEGEKKAACGCAHGIPTIGLGGTWSWRSKKLGLQYLPELNKAAWEGRSVRVVLDSDLKDNDSARKGGEQFVAELRERGADATLVILPPDGDPKVGLDDYIVKYGAEALIKLVADPTSSQAEPWMKELNTKLAVIVDTGEFVALDTGRVYSNTALRNVYSKCGELGAWIKWAGHREVRRLVFEPSAASGVTAEGDYNTWHGWAVEPVKCKATDVQPWRELLEHVLRDVAAKDQHWVECWFGYPVKHPGAKQNTAVLLWSTEHGTGKNALGVTLQHIYGQAWGKVNGDELNGQFNEWAINKQFIVADELKIGDRRGLTNKLKDMITRNTWRVNSKNQKTYEVTDHINYLLTSNHPDAMYVEDRDRRMAVFHVTEKKLPVSEWRKYDEWLKKGGASKLMYYFQHLLDYSAFDPLEAAPVTADKLAMIAAGRSDVESWIAELKSNPDSVLPKHPNQQYNLFRTLDLHRCYDPDGRERVKPNGFATKLGMAGIPRASHDNSVIDGMRQRLWIVRGNVADYQRMTPKELEEAYAAERSRRPSAATNGQATGRVQ